jgi:nitrite reductase/ring-hydroxylating ferredoxin subunit
VLDCRTIECPKHNGRFDVRSGEPVRRPVKVPLATYDIALVDGRLVSDLVPLTERLGLGSTLFRS